MCYSHEDRTSAKASMAGDWCAYAYKGVWLKAKFPELVLCPACSAVAPFLVSSMAGKSLLAFLLLLSVVSAQLSGSVGPTTSLSSKQATICNVLDYGGSIGSSDIGPAISSAFTVSSPSTCLFLPFHQVYLLGMCPHKLWINSLRARGYVGGDLVGQHGLTKSWA